MSSSRRREEQPRLFDLELDSEAPPDGEEVAAEPDLGEPAPRQDSLPEPEELESGPNDESDEMPAPLGTRAFAGLTDLVAHLAVLALALGGVRFLGVVPAAPDLPALSVLLVIFSLFYTVVPLAFWGRTPGMAAAGLQCRSLGGVPLSFGQATRRWAASLLVVASAGLLFLVALSGTSLPDRMSGSRTYLV